MVWLLVTPLVYRVWTPPRTMFMLSDSGSGPTVYQNVDIDYISRNIIAAVISHEDAQLGSRAGPYHLGDYASRTWTYVTAGEDESGSTIPQQLVKNVFLLRGDSFGQEGSMIGVRQAGQIFRVMLKGGDAVLSWPFNLMGDKRQVELYLNYAQFGPNLYGVCAASWYYFNSAPSDVTMTQAATLAGMLPAGENGKRLPGGGVDRTSDGQWVLNSTIERAQNRMPAAIERSGGAEAVAATVGITGAAADPAGEKNSCGAMPASVAERIDAEGGWH